MVALTSKFDILRGWPNGSAVQEDFVIGNSSSDHTTFTHSHATGTWVKLDAAKKDGSMTTKDENASSAFGTQCHLIIEGTDDYSSRFAKRVTCLVGGGYVVRIPQNYKDADSRTITCLNTAASTFAPGDLVKVVDNALTKVTVAALTDVIPNGFVDGQVIAAGVQDGAAGAAGIDGVEINAALVATQANAAQLIEREKAVGQVLAVDTNNNTIDLLVI